MLPAPYTTPGYGPMPQSYGGMPAGYPPGANAWPNITPYGPPVDQTVNERGLWFNRQLVGNRKFYFGLEGLIGDTRRPANFVGDPQANTYPVGYAPGVISTDHNQQFVETPAGTSTIGTPDREVSSSGGTGGNTGGTTGTTATDFPIFVGQSTGSITDGLNAAGMRATWGWTNVDESGFEASGFFLGPASAAMYIGDPLGLTFTTTGGLFTADQTNALNHLHAIAGLPLGGADSDHDGLPGVVMPFDIYYRLQFESQAGGANFDWLTTPIIDRPAFKMRAAYGARYMAIRESFMFDGADSGLGYTINVPVGGGGTTNGTGTTTGTTTQGFLSPVTLEPLVALSIMQSFLQSSVTTQLAGPEAGVRFDIGKDKFKIWTTSKLGLLVNYSSRNLNGYNIGDAYYPKTTGTVTDPTVMPRNNPSATKFAHQDSSTALSPLFEQSIFGKAKLFQYVPIAKKSKILSNADFQAGYTVVVVANMYRPSEDINWQAYPVSPLLNDKRGSYLMSNYSFGVSWEY